MYKQDWALYNPQGLKSHKTQPTNLASLLDESDPEYDYEIQ